MQPAQDASRSQALQHIGELAANLAHDWNNWLTLLAAQFSEIRESAASNPELESRFAGIELTLTQAGDASRRLLDLLRESSGNVLSTSLDFPLRQWEPLLRLFLGPSIHLKLDLNHNPPSILIDTALFARTLFNLAANAKAAMPGGGSLSIRTFTEDGAAVVSISDTGCGFDESTRARLLEPFFSTRADAGGSGLGMATLQQFLDTHHATLRIRSAPGEGAEFQILVPKAG